MTAAVIPFVMKQVQLKQFEHAYNLCQKFAYTRKTHEPKTNVWYKHVMEEKKLYVPVQLELAQFNNWDSNEQQLDEFYVVRT